MKRRKKYKKQKAVLRKAVKSINQQLLNDEIYNGRFQFYYCGSPRVIEYEDKSGLQFYQMLVILDKETGKFDLDICDVNRWIYSNFSQGLYGLGNKFIAEKSGIWKEEPRKTIKNPCNIKNFKYGIQTNFDVFKYIKENKERVVDNYKQFWLI